MMDLVGLEVRGLSPEMGSPGGGLVWRRDGGDSGLRSGTPAFRAVLFSMAANRLR